jgi:hypothetical protein
LTNKHLWYIKAKYNIPIRCRCQFEFLETEEFMKKVGIIFTVLMLTIALMGCTTINVPALTGPASIEKIGIAEGTIYIGIFGVADFGIATAAANGGITRIATVDVQTERVLGWLIVTYRTTVTGE